LITASALAPNCGYIKVLSAKKPKTEAQETSMSRGTLFHGHVERWVKEDRQPAADDIEIQGWLDLMASEWWPTMGHTFTELAWGLTIVGSYVEVVELEPHVYTVGPDELKRSPGATLLTAGRADLAWLDEDHMLRVPDIKTGKWPVAPAAANLQVNAAGLALCQRFFARGYVPGVYYARDGAWDWGDPVEVGTPAWNIQMSAVMEAAKLPPEPRPGDWCGQCWEKRACPMGPR
jgi:hypothetical protein